MVRNPNNYTGKPFLLTSYKRIYTKNGRVMADLDDTTAFSTQCKFTGKNTPLIG